MNNLSGSSQVATASYTLWLFSTTVMSAWFTETAISLEQKVGHANVIPLLEIQICLVSNVNYIIKRDMLVKKKRC